MHLVFISLVSMYSYSWIFCTKLKMPACCIGAILLQAYAHITDGAARGIMFSCRPSICAWVHCPCGGVLHRLLVYVGLKKRETGGFAAPWLMWEVSSSVLYIRLLFITLITFVQRYLLIKNDAHVLFVHAVWLIAGSYTLSEHPAVLCGSLALVCF